MRNCFLQRRPTQSLRRYILGLGLALGLAFSLALVLVLILSSSSSPATKDVGKTLGTKVDSLDPFVGPRSRECRRDLYLKSHGSPRNAPPIKFQSLMSSGLSSSKARERKSKRKTTFARLSENDRFPFFLFFIYNIFYRAPRWYVGNWPENRKYSYLSHCTRSARRLTRFFFQVLSSHRRQL